ncbi:MAG: hypothetical protein HUU28_01850 [Planctomycetaceae bacterium]|nr:hypothetical protein [Planctomycetaceae bacterium]
MTETTEAAKSEAARWRLLHPTLALARGAGLTVVWLAIVPAFVELGIRGGWLLLPIAVMLLALANLVLGLFESLLCMWVEWPRPALWRCDRHDAGPPAFYVSVAALPLLVMGLSWSLRLPDRAFLARHRAELERAVETGEPTETWEVWKEGECTIVRIGSWGIDGCFLIHDPRPEPERGKAGEHDSFLQSAVSDMVRVKGDWFVLRT